MTGERVIVAGVCRRVLAVMATAGLYELSGDWLYEIGMPGKSGVSGGIVTVSPGKGGLATFSPPLDAAGNSVRGQLVTKYLAERLGLNLFASKPAETDRVTDVVKRPPCLGRRGLAGLREFCQRPAEQHDLQEARRRRTQGRRATRRLAAGRPRYGRNGSCPGWSNA